MKITHKMVVSDKLKTIKKVTGWKQQEIAKKLGVSAKTMSLWINNKTQPSMPQEKAIATLYVEMVENNLKENKTKEEIKRLQAKKSDKIMKNFLSEKEKKYYDAKQYVIEKERKNNSKIYFFPSRGQEADSWYKVGGRSFLFYKYYLAPRLGREVNLQDDVDKYCRFRYGIGSARWGSRLIEEAKKIGYEAKKIEYEIIIIELKKVYSKKEIKELEDLVKADKYKLQKMIKPKNNFPKVINAIDELVRILPSKIKTLDSTVRETLGNELLHSILDLEKIYFRMANGRMTKKDAKLEMLNRIDDLSAVMRVLDEGNLLTLTARIRMGENVIKIKNEIEKEL